MKTTGWLNCKETQPVRIGYYEVRLWESNGIPAYYGGVLRFYFDGKLWRNGKGGYKLVGEDRPGWHKKDEWRGVKRPNAEVRGAEPSGGASLSTAKLGADMPPAPNFEGGSE